MEVDAPETELWERYRDDGDPAAQEQLYARHASWAAGIARSIHRRVWAYAVDCEDFIQNASIGLLEAISRYDPDRGVPFRAYATPRVRGAVFNGLRAIIGERHSPGDEARFASRLEHLPDRPGDTAGALGHFVDTVASLGLGFLLESMHASSAELRDGLAYAQSQELDDRLNAAVANLPERLAILIRAHYYNHVPFAELAQAWGLSKGRLSQLHHAALGRLREDLRQFGS